MKKAFCAFLFIVVALAFSNMTAEAASDLKYRIRRRVCEMYDTCPTEDSSLKPSGYTATINTDPVTGVNQSLVSFTISGAQNGDLFNWTLDDADPGTSPLSGNGSISATSAIVSGLNVSSLSDGSLILRVEVSRGGIWGNPVTDTATKSTGGAVFVSFGDGFDDAMASAEGQPMTSNEVTVSGVAGILAVSVSGDASAQVSINGGACAASGSMSADGTISLCANSPAINTSRNIAVLVGSSSAGWKISTASSPASSSILTWGKNTQGNLCDGSFTSKSSPVLACPGNQFKQAGLGNVFGFGLTETGEIWRWGGNQTSASVYTQAAGLAFAGISVGHVRTCGLTEEGKIWCWSNCTGCNSWLGDGTTGPSLVPVAVAPAMTFKEVDAGSSMSACALTTSDDAYCWGFSTWGAIGDGTYETRTTPVAVNGGLKFKDISAGGERTCGITTDSKLYCWGVVPGMSGGHPNPVLFSTAEEWSYVSTKYSHGCALNGMGQAFCWSAAGASGGVDPASNVPTLVPGIVFQQIETGTLFTCGVSATGDGYCWGNNEYGRLGIGSGSDAATPTHIASSAKLKAIKTVANGWEALALVDGTPVDTHAPTVSTLSPQPGSTDIAEDANLIMTFGENVVKGTGNIVIRKLSDGTAFETISVADAKVSIAGKVATINPAGLFASNMAYYVEVAPGAFKDSSGNAFAGITGSFSWGFTSEVSDFAPPLVSSLSPGNGATGVGAAANLVVTFDEPVVKGAGNIVIKRTLGNTVLEAIPVTDARVSISGNAATINPIGGFAEGAGYYVEVAAGAFRDVSGNVFEGITGSGTWAFASMNALGMTVLQGNPADMAVANGESSGENVVFKVTNSSAVASGVISVSLTGDTGNFNKTVDTCSGVALAALASCSITVQPVAGANGSYAGTLLASAGPGGNLQASLAGTASGFEGVYCWGYNVSGQLGDGSTSNRDVPHRMAISGTAEEMSADQNHTCVRKADGTVWCWGSNSLGQLGDGTGVDSPVPVQAGIFGAVQIGGSAWHNCAIMNDSTIMCWGYNGYGNLGMGATENQYSPVLIDGSNYTQADGDNFTTCARKTDGTAWCWGMNIGVLPVQMTSLGNTVAEVAVGEDHFCSRKTDGTVWCWGANDEGQLGNGTTTASSEPVQVLNLDDVVQLVSGYVFNCALKTDGTVWCWGFNGFGGLGDGTIQDSSFPIQVSGLVGVEQIANNDYHACARKTDGSLWCWGINESGQLGNGTLIYNYVPVRVSGSEGIGYLNGVADVSVGSNHTCAIVH